MNEGMSLNSGTHYIILGISYINHTFEQKLKRNNQLYLGSGCIALFILQINNMHLRILQKSFADNSILLN